MAKVQIYCRAYNVKPYLELCISSVLSQTYSDFEFFLIDNGCTDGSSEVIDAFAAQDPRIQVIRFEENASVRVTLYGIIQDNAKGYITIIDSDDWWAPDYLEKLVFFAEKNHLDIACTGSYAYQDETGNASVLRSLEHPLILERSELADFFSVYHVFFRTYWAKLFRAEALPQGNLDKFWGYGSDTLYAFDILSRSRRIGIDSTVLHYYRVHGKSSSYNYNTVRFSADVAQYDDALCFLSGFGPLSAKNRQFLRVVFSNAVLDSVCVLSQANIPPQEKAMEFRNIAGHSFTRDAFQNEPMTKQCYAEVVFHALKIARRLGEDEFADMAEAIKALLPQCGKCVTVKTLPLFWAEPPLMDALREDDQSMLLDRLLILIQKKRYVKQYDLGSIVQTLAEDVPLLNDVGDMVFMRKYASIYQMIWQGQTAEALDEMTGLLLEGRVQGAKETFLRIYLNTAALLEEIPAFIFGNIRMAEFYLQRKDWEKCRTILNSLDEMGVEENEETAELRKCLKEVQHTV